MQFSRDHARVGSGGLAGDGEPSIKIFLSSSPRYSSLRPVTNCRYNFEDQEKICKQDNSQIKLF